MSIDATSRQFFSPSSQARKKYDKLKQKIGTVNVVIKNIYESIKLLNLL